MFTNQLRKHPRRKPQKPGASDEDETGDTNTRTQQHKNIGTQEHKNSRTQKLKNSRTQEL